MNRNDLYPCGMPKPQPDPNHIRQTVAWEIVTLVVLIAGVIALAVR